MRRRQGTAGRLSVFIVAVAAMAACSGGSGGGDDGGAAPGTTASTTSATTSPPATAGATSTSGPGTTASPGPSACQGIDVENPGIVTLSAADGSPCWTALSDWNAYAVAVAEGRLLVLGGACGGSTDDQQLVALDISTGSEVWRLPISVGDDFRSVMGTGLGVIVPPTEPEPTEVRGIDVATGAVLWTVPGRYVLGDGTDVAIVAGGNSDSPTISVLERRTGAMRWTMPAVDGALHGAAADATSILIGTDAETLVFDAVTGAQRAPLPIVAASDTPSVRLADGVATGVSAAGPDATSTRGYDPVSGAELWTSPGYPPQRPEPTDGNVYVILDAGVAALDPHTGEVRWTVEGVGLEAGPGLAIATIDNPDAPLEAIDPATGELRWSTTSEAAGLPTTTYQNVLPSAAGAYFAYGNCLGS